MAINYVKAKKLSMKLHPELTETWVQDMIEKDPSILGLGKLYLRDKQRIQPNSGRLDLLLQDEELTKRYEVEIQLGRVDESHIIRTIEYWDVERKRYPQYEHCAVIIAEDLTSRFLNVINLFNGSIPLIAIQMNAFEIGETTTLTFVTVLDQTSLGLDYEDEITYVATTRAHWESKGSKKTVAMADELLELIKTISADYAWKYNKFYIGPAINNNATNFLVVRPQKDVLRAEFKIIQNEDTDTFISKSGIELVDYNSRDRTYRINLRKDDIDKHKDALLNLIQQAYGQY